MKKNLLFLSVVLSALTLNAKTVYLNTANGWEDGGCNKFAVWQWADGGQGQFTAFMTQVKDHIWTVDVTEQNLLFVRFNPNLAAPKWTENDDNSSWGQTCDLTLGDYDLYTPDMNWNADCEGFGGQWGTYDPNGTPEVTPGNNTGDGGHTYWLIGHFDGQDKGDAADFNSTYDEYKFQNGKLAVQFTNNSGGGYSYACVKDDEGNWYMTKAWDEAVNTGNPCTLYWTGFGYSEPNKWRLPNLEQLYIIMTKCDFKNEIELKMVDKATFDSYSLNNNDDTAVEYVKAVQITVQNGAVLSEQPVTIFNIAGQNVTAQNGNLHGLYIIMTGGNAHKVAIP